MTKPTDIQTRAATLSYDAARMLVLCRPDLPRDQGGTDYAAGFQAAALARMGLMQYAEHVDGRKLMRRGYEPTEIGTQVAQILRHKIFVEREPPDVGTLGLHERCCFCRVRTEYWTLLFTRKPGQQVACCPMCADNHESHEVPTKDDWWDRERALEGERR